MTRCLISIFLLLLSVSAFAQKSDSQLVLETSFSESIYDESIPESYSAFAKVAEVVSRQLTGECYFEPKCYLYFEDAVRKNGVIPGFIITTDRLTRCSRIGMAGHKEPAVVPRPDSFAEYPVMKKASSVSADYDFIQYLFGNGMDEESVALLEGTEYSPSDTLNYLRGWSYYSTQRLEKAVKSFSSVPSESPFYDKSLFFAVASDAHLGEYGHAGELLSSYTGPFAEVAKLQEAGLALLKGDRDGYLTAASAFTLPEGPLGEGERKLSEIFSDRFERKSKSPFLAAAASAVVPGLGKIYAGQLGEGVSSFLVCGSLAALTADSWNKKGLANWKTILFGSLGAAFYIGNIYGSYISVGLYNESINGAQDVGILYNIHIPLRSLFN